MKLTLQRQPNPKACFVTALAVAINTPVEEIIAAVGHDGTVGGFHNQELLDYCMARSLCMIPIELEPGWVDGEALKIDAAARIRWYVGSFVTLIGIDAHIVACDGTTVYDPLGGEYTLDLDGLLLEGRIKDIWIVGRFSMLFDLIRPCEINVKQMC